MRRWCTELQSAKGGVLPHGEIDDAADLLDLLDAPGMGLQRILAFVGYQCLGKVRGD